MSETYTAEALLTIARTASLTLVIIVIYSTTAIRLLMYLLLTNLCAMLTLLWTCSLFDCSCKEASYFPEGYGCRAKT